VYKCNIFLQKNICWWFYSPTDIIEPTKIPKLRKENKLSQAELGEIVGVTRQTITSIETGKYIASLPLAYKIAKYFGLKIEDVFLLEEEEFWI